LKRLLSLVAAVALVVIAVGLCYLAYYRIGTPIQLIRHSAVVDGVVTEKLIQPERLSPLPIDVPTYVVRYTFPNLQGQMRTGEQKVTAAFYNQLGDQGSPVAVTIYPENPATNAVDARISFPDVAGIRLGAALLSLLIAYLIVFFGVIERQKSRD
jgi:hypothetical protein